MNAKYTVEYESDFSKMFNSIKDVNVWHAFERLTKSLQNEICEEIDRETLKKLAAQFAVEKGRYDQQGYLHIRL